MTEPLKLCRDCKWCRYPGERKSSCFHDEASREVVDFITGEARPPLILCQAMRGVPGPCGVEARLFEPRKAT